MQVKVSVLDPCQYSLIGSAAGFCDDHTPINLDVAIATLSGALTERMHTRGRALEPQNAAWYSYN